MGSIMAIDPGVTSGVCVTNILQSGTKFDDLMRGIYRLRDIGRGMGGKGPEGKLGIDFGEVVVATELLPGSFVAWFQIGPVRGFDHEYWTAVCLAELIELCHVQWLAIEDFILRPGVGGVSGNRDGLSAVRLTSCLMTLLRERHLTPFQGIRGGTECKASKRDGMHLGYRSGARVLWQQPSQAKSVFTDERLRREALWIVGREHARDAMRHLCLAWRSVEGQKVKEWKPEMQG